MSPSQISALIDNSPMNRGMFGAEWLAAEGNIAIETDGNVFLFEQILPAVYEFHWLHTETSGSRLAKVTLAAFDEVFQREPNCEVIFGLAPSKRLDVRVMANAIHMKRIASVDTPDGPCVVFTVTREMRNVVS
jgi:hypothetical protein